VVPIAGKKICHFQNRPPSAVSGQKRCLPSNFLNQVKSKIMLVIGRITKDAVVKQLKNEKQVVEFSVAVNDYFKPKNGEVKKFTFFLRCSYWSGTGIAQRLKKGALVELNGRLFLHAFTVAQGEPKALLNCHVNKLRIHHIANPENPDCAQNEEDIPSSDLPF
jgi:single-strand DNA-binding protein